jgi:hypothetical protein
MPPQVLRDLTALLEALVRTAAPADAVSDHPSEGGGDEQAGAALRSGEKRLGGETLAEHSRARATEDRRVVGDDGQMAMRPGVDTAREEVPDES